MVANTKDAPKEGGDKADKGASGEGASGGGGIKAWLPLIITIVLMPVLAFAVTKFVLVPQLQKGLGIAAHSESSEAESGGGESAGGGGGHGAPAPEAKEGGHGSSTKPGKVKQTASINKMLTNVGGTMAARYLLTSITLSSGAKDFKSMFELNEPKLKDVAMGILRLKTLVDLEKPGAVNTIRSELITGFNSVLGENVIEEIYLTEFAVQ